MKSKNSRYFLVYAALAAIILVAGCKEAGEPGETKKKTSPSAIAKKKTKQELLAASLDDAVNSPGDDLAPIISADGNLLYFTSDKPGGRGGQDVWFSRREGARWTRAQNLAELNTRGDEGLDTFNQDGSALYFTADRPGGRGDNDIYICHHTPTGWSKPENVGPPINTKHSDANASLSADGKKLFFVSDRPGGMGGYDIWMSELGPNGKWGKPTNLGKQINTDGWEGNVFIAPDGETLYFSSNGHGGFGGADVFRSILRDGEWSEPDNLGDRINTTGNDTYFTIPASGDMAYMTSSRLEGKGGADIIAVPMPILFTPKKIVVVAGKVTDSQTGEPMQAYVKVKYRPTRRDIAVTTTRPDGNFKLAFAPLDGLMLMIYTDDKSVYPYYKSIPIDMSKENQVVVRRVAMASDTKPVEVPKEPKTPK